METVHSFKGESKGTTHLTQVRALGLGAHLDIRLGRLFRSFSGKPAQVLMNSTIVSRGSLVV